MATGHGKDDEECVACCDGSFFCNGKSLKKLKSKGKWGELKVDLAAWVLG